MNPALLAKILDAMRASALAELERHRSTASTDPLHVLADHIARNVAMAIPAFVDPVFEELEREYVAGYTDVGLELDHAGVPSVDLGGEHMSLLERIQWLAEYADIPSATFERDEADASRETQLEARRDRRNS